MAVRNEEGRYDEKTSSDIFILAKVYRTMTSGRQGAPYFRRYGRELVSKTGDFVEENFGGSRLKLLKRETPEITTKATVGGGGNPVFTTVLEPLARAIQNLTWDKNASGGCFGAALKITIPLWIDFVKLQHQENVTPQRNRGVTGATRASGPEPMQKTDPKGTPLLCSLVNLYRGTRLNQAPAGTNTHKSLR